MIAIVDYGLGNIKAFANVYRRLNIDYCYASTVDDLRSASKIILPGVGAFDHAMRKLNDSGLRDTLDELVLVNRIPVIGICVGMQMMAESSEEGLLAGLGWIPGIVQKFSHLDEAMRLKFPLPHMGWNNIVPIKKDPLTDGFDDEKRFYFLHSYYFRCADNDNILSTASYGIEYACMINRQNIYGIQCHPEKSHHNGVKLLSNFASL